MSYRVGTPNYNLPQTEGTDKRDWSDTNGAFLAIDTAIKNAVDTSASASSAASTAQQTADGANTAAAHAQTDATTAQTLATSASELATTAKNRADDAYSLAGNASGDIVSGKVLVDYSPTSGTFKDALNHIYTLLTAQLSGSECVKTMIRVGNLIIRCSHASDSLIIYTGLDQLQGDGYGMVMTEFRLSQSGESVCRVNGYHSVTGWYGSDNSLDSASGVRFRVYV